MARYDKYEPYANGFRGVLAADFAVTGGNYDFSHVNLGKPFGIGLDANGAVVLGAGVTGLKGFMILTKPKFAGEITDVMTSGECVEWETSAGVAGVAGFNYYAVAATGLVVAGTGAGGTVQPSGSIPIGWTMEVTSSYGARFVTRVPGIVTASA